MAVVRYFEHIEQGQQAWRGDDVAGEIVALELRGERFLQLYSLGSKARVRAGERSQNLRLSQEAFEQLVAIGRKHFGEK